MRQSFT